MKKILLIVLAAVVTVGLVTTVVLVFTGSLTSPAGSSVQTGDASASPGAASSGSQTPTSGATGIPTSSASTGLGTAKTPPGEPGQNTPRFTSVDISSSVSCPVPGEGPNGSTAESPSVQLDWASDGALTVFIGVDTTDAQAEPYATVDRSGSQAIPFPCPRQSQEYTITLVGPGGVTSKTVTVKNLGYRG